MTIWPVIERELRSQSRLALTYGLRVLGVAALLMVCLGFGLTYGLKPSQGGRLFSYLHATLFMSIWILVPMLCADCISRERREGTVGLLFLTPLRSRDVVLAKGLVHGLRAFSLLLAVLPIITIALLLGGVSAGETALSVMMNFSALCWAVATGLLASSLSKSWLRSQLLAGIFTFLFGFLFLVVAGYNTRSFMGRGVWLPFSTTTEFDRVFQIGFLTGTNGGGWWGMMLGTLTPAKQSSWLWAQGRVVVGSIVFLFVVIQIAARILQRAWRDEPPSARQVWLEKKLFTPVLLVSFLRRWMRRKLERNPIGWLEHRTWSGRLVTWGWFAVMISIYSAALGNSDVSHSLDILQRFMAWLLLGIVAISAAGSFQRERETGVLELLLVSPMSVGQIIGGRLRGLWGQFLPAFVLLLGIWAYLSGFFPGRQAAGGLIQFFCGAFLTVPIIGLYYSLRRSNFMTAFLCTLFVGLAIPFGLQSVLNSGVQFILGMNAYYFRDINQSQSDDSLTTLLVYAVWRLISLTAFLSLVQLVIAAWTGRRLYQDMVRRNFAFTKAIT